MIQCPEFLMYANGEFMEIISIILYVLEIIIGFVLFAVAVNLIKLIKSNVDKTVASVERDINQKTTAIAIMLIALMVINIILLFTK